MGCFVNQELTAMKTIGSYYGTLVSRNMLVYGRKQKGEWVMAVPSSAYQRYAIQLKTNVRCLKLREDTPWIVVAKFNSFRFVNHRRSLPGSHLVRSVYLGEKQMFGLKKNEVPQIGRTLLGLISLQSGHFGQFLTRKNCIWIMVLATLFLVRGVRLLLATKWLCLCGLLQFLQRKRYFLRRLFDMLLIYRKSEIVVINLLYRCTNLWLCWRICTSIGYACGHLFANL